MVLATGCGLRAWTALVLLLVTAGARAQAPDPCDALAKLLPDAANAAALYARLEALAATPAPFRAPSSSSWLPGGRGAWLTLDRNLGNTRGLCAGDRPHARG